MRLRTLAALAAVPLTLAFSGCVDGGLESGYEPLEAIGSELPEGVSAGPDGAIVIDRGLAAPEGFTGGVLDEEGWEALARLTGFTCSSIWQCYSKCPWDALCICRWNGSVWECEVIYPEDFCKWFDCEGTGEGGDWRKRVSLDCGLPVTRGQVASCTVETGNGLNRNLLTSHWFAWEMGTSKSGGLEWGGTATETTEIEVVLTMAVVGETTNLRETVQVRARDWGLQTQHAVLQYAYWFGTKWGLYRVDENLAEIQVRQGTGPWARSHYLHGTPWIDSAEMYAHSDLVAWGEPYPLFGTICGQLPGNKVTVHFLNGVCGYGGTLAAFNSVVVAHENEHQNSLNKCIESMNNGKLAEVERTVGTYDGVNAAWDGVIADLVSAAHTNQRGQKGGPIWEWRKRLDWRYRAVSAEDHNGRIGC